MKNGERNRIILSKSGPMRVDALIYADDNIELEPTAVQQLRDATAVPGVERVIATPDIHQGWGVPIGSIVAMRDGIIPAAVGYDVNCGMRVILTGLTRDQIDAKKLGESIRRDVPLGAGENNVRLSRDEVCRVLDGGVRALAEMRRSGHRVWDCRDEAEEADDLLRMEDGGSMRGDHSKVSAQAIERGMSQLATLGGGNHFIEFQYVESVADARTAALFGIKTAGQVVIMIHTGSRGLGHQIGTDYMRTAARMTLSECPNRDLCYLPAESDAGQGYIGAMNAAANFAFVNRQMITMLVRRNVRHHHPGVPMPLLYDVPHNMAKRELHFGREVWVHRKGATRAYPKSRMSGTPFAGTGQPVIIPGSMGTASYILVGTEESAEALNSVNHGAGRAMSRAQAVGKVQRGTGRIIRPGAISDDQFQRSMEGIHLICRDWRAIKEEAPAAYKDIDAVIRVVVEAGLARIVARLRPFAVLKG